MGVEVNCDTRYTLDYVFVNKIVETGTAPPRACAAEIRILYMIDFYSI